MKKYNLIPALLLVYLAFMCYIGYPEYAAGNYSPLRYFGVAAISLGCIVALRITLKRRHDRLEGNQNR